MREPGLHTDIGNMHHSALDAARPAGTVRRTRAAETMRDIPEESLMLTGDGIAAMAAIACTTTPPGKLERARRRHPLRSIKPPTPPCRRRSQTGRRGSPHVDRRKAETA